MGAVLISMRRALLSLACIVAAGCTNPLSFGPGRVDIALESVSVVKTTPPHVARREGRPSVRITFTSETDLALYFDQWKRRIEMRCRVTGTDGSRYLVAYGAGPFYGTVDIRDRSKGPRSGRDEGGLHRYTVYSFFDLRAEDRVYDMERPQSSFDLASQPFERLECYVIGVTKALPYFFPRSNEVAIPREQFLKSLEVAK
jgi:hypothetical protein